MARSRSRGGGLAPLSSCARAIAPRAPQPPVRRGSSAWRAVTRSVAATRAASAPSAGASARAARTSAPVRASRAAPRSGTTTTSTRAPATTSSAEPVPATSTARSPRRIEGGPGACLVLELPGAEVGAARHDGGRPPAHHLLGHRRRAHWRVAGGDTAQSEVRRADAPPRRELAVRDDDVDQRCQLRAQRRLAATDVRSGETAEGEREADQQRAAAPPAHRASGGDPSAQGSSSTRHAPAALGPAASRPP